MRILTVLTSLGVGGAEKQALAVAERIERCGHEVAVLVLRAKLPDEWPTALPVIHLGISRFLEKPASIVAGWRRARHFVRDFCPDVVHSHSFHANVVARMLGSCVPGVAVISTVHNVYEGSWMRMWAYRLTDGWSDCTVAVSKAAAERFLRLKAIPRHKCVVRTNGIDSAEFAPVSERRAATRSAMGVDSSFIWLSAGRVAPAKDFPNLLRALALVHREAPDTELWIAGALVDQKEPLTANGPERVRWLGLRRDMPALMDAADGFVLASAWEGMPLVVGEAMAMEKPVVATDVGGVHELMGNHGVIVPAKDSTALATGMLKTMRQTREERAELGRAARARIVREFSIDAVADWWEEFYKQAIANRE